MGDKCGKCGSTNLEPRDHDLWHYMRNCKNCGTRTRFNSKGKIVETYGGKSTSSKTGSNDIMSNFLNGRVGEPSKITGHIEGLGGIKSIIDNLGRNSGTIDGYGNIKDTFGRITGHVDSFGNIKDSFGNIKGYIDSFGNVKKS